LTGNTASRERGVIPVSDVPSVSTWSGKGRHRAGPHSDRSAKAGQEWSRHEVVGIVPASSVLTRELINVSILGEALACQRCGYVPVWDSEGNLVCNCKIWTDPDPTQKLVGSPDSAIERQKRNQNYQNDLRKFFKKGGR